MISSPDSTKPSNDRYKQGFFDCIAETVRFLVGAEGLIINEQIKTKLLIHLRDYFAGLAYGSQKVSLSFQYYTRVLYKCTVFIVVVYQCYTQLFEKT